MTRDAIYRALREYNVPVEKAKAAAERHGSESAPPSSVQAAQRLIARAARKKLKVQREREFRVWCRANGLPNPASEYVFAKGTHNRQWRFDWAWADPDTKGGVALEVEGGVWSGGRHTRGAGYTEDTKKYGVAVTLGWRLVRATTATLYSDETLTMLTKLLLPQARAA